AQAQPRTCNSPAALAAVEALQHGLALRGGYSGAVILHDDLRSGGGAVEEYPHRAIGSRELDGVVDQVCQRFEKQLGVPLNGEAAIGLNDESRPFGLSQRLIQVGNRSQYVGEIDNGKARTPPA